MKELFDVTVSIIVETEKAWLVSDGDKEAWIPKSQAEIEREKDGSYTLTAPQSLLKEKGFI
jgi:hypothetical protein